MSAAEARAAAFAQLHSPTELAFAGPRGITFRQLVGRLAEDWSKRPGCAMRFRQVILALRATLRRGWSA